MKIENNKLTTDNGQKQVELVMQTSLQLLPLIMNNIPQAVFWKNRDLVYLGCNQAFADDAGFSTPEEIVGKTDFDMPWTNQAELYRADDRLVMEKGEPKLNYEEPQTTPNGSTIWLSTSKIPVYENGQVIAVLAMYEDITTRKQAEKELLLRDRALASSLNAVVILNLQDSKPIYVNDAILKMTGYTREEVMQVGLADITGNTEEPKKIRAAIQSQGFFVGEELIKRKDGSVFPANFFSSLITDDKGQPIAVQSSFFDISERKQAEQAQQESEERFRSLYNNATIGLYRTTPDGQILMINPTGLHLLGFDSFEELAKRNLEEAGFEEEDARRNFREKIEREGIIEQESVWTKKDGTPIFVRESSTVSRDDNGNVLYYDGSFEDITADKQAEEALRASEERFKRFTEATVEGLVFHEQGKIIDVNPAAVAIFGLTNFDELIGRNLLEFVVPEYHQTVLKQMQLESVAPYEIRGIRKDGSTVAVETSTRAYRDGERVIRASSIRDITDRKQAEADTLREKNTSDAIINSLPGIFYMFDVQGSLIRRNKNYESVVGYSAEEIATRNALDAVAEEDRERAAQAIQRAFTEGKVELEVLFQTRHGEKIPYFMTAVRMAVGNDMYVVGTGLDLSERKHLEQQIQTAFERRGYQVQVSTEISQEVASTTELSDLFSRVVTLTKERLGYYHTQLLRYDADRDAVVLINGYGEIGQKMLVGGHQMPMGQGLIGTAAASGETVLRPILSDDPDWHPNPLLPDTQGEIAVPIKWQNSVLGVLDVQSNQAGALNDEDRLLFEGLCGQIAIAMHNAELVETVRQNEARLAEALKTARLANWEYDVEKDIFTFNDQFYSIFHTTAEKAGGYQLSSARYAELFVHPDDMEIVGTEIGKALGSTERVYNATIDHRIKFEDGGIGYVTVQLTVERDENGKITRYYGANQDITERKQAEEALRVNEARLGEALRAARLGNWEYDFENDLFVFTDDFYSIFRTTAERVGGYKISSADYSKNFVHPDDAPLVGSEIQKVLDAKDRLFTTHMEHRIIFSDGEVGYIAVNINVERDENGKITRWYGANQDITERKQAEEALRVNEARLTEALKIARLANWEYDVEKDIFTFNDQFYSLFHTTAKQHGGYQLSSAYYAQHFVYPDDLPIVGVEIGQALNSTERYYSRNMEHRILYADGVVGHMQVNINVERDENGKITRYYGANQDITERKKEQEALAERLEEINRLNKAMSREGWQDYRETGNVPTGFIFDQGGLRPVKDTGLAEELFANFPLTVPGGETIGNLTIVDDPQRPLSPEDEAFLQQISEQVAMALESARLFEQTQSALYESKESQELTRNVIDSTDDWIFVKDRNHRYQLVNQGYANALHISAEEFIGKDDLELGFPEELVKGNPEKGIRGFWADDQLVLDSGKPQHYPDDPASIDGKIRIFDTIKIPLRDASNNVWGVLAFSRDLTERKQAEGLIAQRATQLEAVATVSTTASTVLDPDKLLQAVVDLTKERFNLYHTHIYLADDAWNTLLLAAGAGEVGRQMVETGHAIEMDAEKSLVARALRERNSIIVNDVRGEAGFLPNPMLPETRAEMAVPMIVGDKVIGVFDVQSDTQGHFTDADANIYTTLASQVAVALQNARLYVEQAATVTQLRELDRLKSSFLANMSHELRTPLNSILGFADVMLEGLDGDLTDNMQNDLGLIYKNGQHLLHLINDVLDMAKIESGKMNLNIEKFNIQETIEEVTSITSGLANEKNLKLFIEPDSDPDAEINADKIRLRQVMINLVNNAIKFTEKGQIAIRVTREENNILISVKDSGLGIPTDHLESVFQEFTQVDTTTTRKAGGTGLGLPISRKLIEMHSGRLWAESSGVEGEGSTFYVFLPIEAKINETQPKVK